MPPPQRTPGPGSLGIRRLAVVPSAAFAMMLAIGGTSLEGGESLAAAKAERSVCQRAHTKPWKLSRKQARKTMVCLINRTREDHGLRPVARNRRLQKAAQRHNRAMHGTGCFSHACPGEEDLSTRLREVGYLGGDLRRWVYAENLAWGTGYGGEPASILDAWMHSAGHRHTILTAELRDIGVGFHVGTPASKRARGAIFTTDFGHRVR